MSQFSTLLKFNFSVEFKNIAQTLSLLLLAWIVCYILYKVHPSLNATEFGYIYWLFMMLISVNVCLRSESHHTQELRLYLYSLIDPVSLYLAKVIFNLFYIAVVALLFYLSFIVYFSEQVIPDSAMIGVIIAGAFGLSSCLTYVSAISTYANGQNTLVSILALPLLLPIILSLQSMTEDVVAGSSIEVSKYSILFGISLISVACSLILFPIIWKE